MYSGNQQGKANSDPKYQPPHDRNHELSGINRPRGNRGFYSRGRGFRNYAIFVTVYKRKK